MSIKLAAVSMIRNECDILELFIRINSRIFDAIYIIDHLSSDGTPLIISELKKAGFPVGYCHLNSSEFNQGEIVTGLVRQLAELNLYDYIMPLDADEFLLVDSKSALEKVLKDSLAGNEFGLIPWKTFCPIADHYYHVESPLYDLFRARTEEPEQYYKVIIGNAYAKNCKVSLGSHSASNEATNCQPLTLPLTLAHVPIRSVNQMINKVILGSHAFRHTSKRVPGQGFHWDLMAKLIREKDFEIAYDDIVEVALRYAVSENSSAQTPSIDIDSARIGLKADSIEFKKLAIVNNLKSFDDFMLNIKP